MVKKTTKRISTTKTRSKKKEQSETGTIKVEAPKKNSKRSTVKLAQSASQKNLKYTPPPEEKKLNDDGDISRMREERRDLYDLLYGDDGDMEEEDDINSDAMLNSFSNNGIINADKAEEIFDDAERIEMTQSSLSFYSSSEYLEDDNLDDYDPYNLSDY
jgi:hypothetical protein